MEIDSKGRDCKDKWISDLHSLPPTITFEKNEGANIEQEYKRISEIQIWLHEPSVAKVCICGSSNLCTNIMLRGNPTWD